MDSDLEVECAKSHTIKKFELIEKYVEAWTHKLLQNKACQGLLFIDCMCNSGEYIDEHGNKVYGTPIRIAKILRDAAGQYPNKQIDIYFNDKDKNKVRHLTSLLGKDKNNFHIHLSSIDANDLLYQLHPQVKKKSSIHSLLMYDPYDANIDWNAIMPFLNNWGEVIINHMVSDSVRALNVVRSPKAVAKYEQTYLSDIKDLIPYATNRDAYEKRVENIIKSLRTNASRKYYIAAVPFFNKRNALVYNLIHCTSSLAGFKLYKNSAWKIFGGKSSTKNTHGQEKQLYFSFEDTENTKNITNNQCYYIQDIARFLQQQFIGQRNVPIDRVWQALDNHPIFPSEGFRSDIKKILKDLYGAEIKTTSISFSSGGKPCTK